MSRASVIFLSIFSCQLFTNPQVQNITSEFQAGDSGDFDGAEQHAP